MFKTNSIGRVFLLSTAMCVLVMGFIPAAVGGEDETEILNITVGEPTHLSDRFSQNTASVAVSRTGNCSSLFYAKTALRE